MLPARFKRWLEQLLHTHDTPHRTALAYAVGVFFGFSPVLGLHTVLTYTYENSAGRLLYSPGASIFVGARRSLDEPHVVEWSVGLDADPLFLLAASAVLLDEIF